MLTIIGARPQFIKAAPLSIALKKIGIEEIILHTGQHYDEMMSKIFFDQLLIPKPKYNLNLGGLSHSESTGKMMIEVENILIKEMPNAIIVFGDTNTTLAGAISAVKLHIPVIHIEAGLRSYNKKMPEEINRICTDHVSSLLFAPTESSKNNLQKEGITENVEIVGDIMLDSLNLVKNQIEFIDGSFILCTLHRQENVDNPKRLKLIIDNLVELSNIHDVILPIHPRTKKKIQETGISLGNIRTIQPQGYIEFLSYLKSSICLITDSGGAQKEAYYLDKNVLVMRQETEWLELIKKGYNKLWSDKLSMIDQIIEFLNRKKPFENNQIYGSGKTSNLIVKSILKKYGSV